LWGGRRERLAALLSRDLRVIHRRRACSLLCRFSSAKSRALVHRSTISYQALGD
jgi:hypothetical protein